MTLSLKEDVKLRETENAWKPARMKTAISTEDEAKNDVCIWNFHCCTVHVDSITILLFQTMHNLYTLKPLETRIKTVVKYYIISVFFFPEMIILGILWVRVENFEWYGKVIHLIELHGLYMKNFGGGQKK